MKPKPFKTIEIEHSVNVSSTHADAVSRVQLSLNICYMKMWMWFPEEEKYPM